MTADPSVRGGRIEISGLRAGYGSGPPVLDLDRLTIESGEFCSILGPSGCGKTTLLNCLAGFVDPLAGEIRLDGSDVTTLPPERRGLGMVFQNYALFPHMSVADNVGYGLRVRRLPEPERTARVAEVLDLVGLSAFAGRRPRQLSGGQQQRVAIARALAIRPPVLLLDEPLSNLDAKLRREMRVELRQLQDRVGTTMVFVTHDQDEALALSDRVAVLDHGRLQQVAAPDEVYRRPANRFVAEFLGAANVLEQPDGTAIAIRPERIRLEPAATGSSGRLPAAATPGRSGTVDYRAFAGDAWHVSVELDDDPEAAGGRRALAVTVPDGPADPPPVGHRVRAGWELADQIELPPEDTP